MIEATVMPLAVDVEDIAEEALQAAFKTIADRMSKAGYPVSGDFAPDEVAELDHAFKGYVLTMALNNQRIYEMQDEENQR